MINPLPGKQEISEEETLNSTAVSKEEVDEELEDRQYEEEMHRQELACLRIAVSLDINVEILKSKQIKPLENIMLLNPLDNLIVFAEKIVNDLGKIIHPLEENLKAINTHNESLIKSNANRDMHHISMFDAHASQAKFVTQMVACLQKICDSKQLIAKAFQSYEELYRFGQMLDTFINQAAMLNVDTEVINGLTSVASSREIIVEYCSLINCVMIGLFEHCSLDKTLGASVMDRLEGNEELIAFVKHWTVGLADCEQFRSPETLATGWYILKEAVNEENIPVTSPVFRM